MPNIDLSILNQRQTPAFFADTLANRPAAGFLGRIFVSTDTFAFYRDNGTGWDLIGGPGTGTITGSGANGQIALWNGASTIVGDSGLTYDGTANSLTASKYIVTGGTSTEFLKGDGSLDSSTYLTTNIYNGNGTLSGERTISLNGNNLIFDGGSSVARVRIDADTNIARIFSFATNNLARWALRIDGTESGTNAGSDFAIRRYDDTGAFVDAPLSINRATGQSTFAKKVVIENNAGDQQLQLVSSTAPSLRIDNIQTGATKRIGIGLATAVNNFIQGSVDRDMAIFNSSTTASPILFGIYDAGLTNTQEAARISAARNFLVGGVVDNGAKLQVSGQAYINHNDASVLRILRNGGSNTNTGIEFVNASTSANIGSNGSLFGLGGTNGSIPAQPFIIVPSSSEKIRLDANGNFGIGTSPSTRLNVVKEDNGGGGIGRFEANNRTQYVEIGYQNINQFATVSSNAQLTFSLVGNESFRIASSTLNVLIGTTIDSGQKLQVGGETYTTILTAANDTNGQYQTRINGNSVNSQGACRWRTYARGILGTGAGNKLNIPFVSQGNLNIVTVARVIVCAADFNSSGAPSAQFMFSVGSLNALSNLTILSSGGSFVSATTSGMNVVATISSLSAAYILIEYMTPEPSYSIDLGNITLTS